MKKYCPEWVRPRSGLAMRDMKLMTFDGCMDIWELTVLGLLLLSLLFLVFSSHNQEGKYKYKYRRDRSLNNAFHIQTVE